MLEDDQTLDLLKDSSYIPPEIKSKVFHCISSLLLFENLLFLSHILFNHLCGTCFILYMIF